MCVCRVPKSGSSTVREFSKSILKRSRSCLINLKDAMSTNARKFGENPGPLPLVYGHIIYVPFARPEMKDVYFRHSILRDPASRIRSLFYYFQRIGRVRKEVEFLGCFEHGFCQPPAQLLNISRDEPGFVDKVDEIQDAHYRPIPAKPVQSEMEKNLYKTISNNYMTRFFCGSQQICLTGSANELLQEAKRVIAQEIDIVATMPDLLESLRLMNWMVPQLMGKPRDLSFYEDFPRKNVAPSSLPTQKLTAELTELLETYNYLDKELYEFAGRVFEEKKKACHEVFGLVDGE